MFLQNRRCAAYRNEGGGMGEYSIQVLNWIIVDWYRVSHFVFGSRRRGQQLNVLSLPASREDGAFDAPFML